MTVWCGGHVDHVGSDSVGEMFCSECSLVDRADQGVMKWFKHMEMIDKNGLWVRNGGNKLEGEAKKELEGWSRVFRIPGREPSGGLIVSTR